jgi:hypothetical protein
LILGDETKLIAGKVAQGTPNVESLREYLALTIAVVGATVGATASACQRTVPTTTCALVPALLLSWARTEPRISRRNRRHSAHG